MPSESDSGQSPTDGGWRGRGRGITQVVVIVVAVIYFARAPAGVSLPDGGAAGGEASQPVVSVIRPLATRASR